MDTQLQVFHILLASLNSIIIRVPDPQCQNLMSLADHHSFVLQLGAPYIFVPSD